MLAIIRDGRGVQELSAGESGEVILDHTPFYAESGGQVGDRGWFYSDDHNTLMAEVKGCYSPIQGVRAHQEMVVKSSRSAVVESKSPPSAKNAEGWGTLRVGDKVDAVVDAERRVATMRNHTATHLLHAGLREVLGKHVKQAGSLVAADHLRFDFSHFTAVKDEELQDIESLINKELLRNLKVETLTDVPIDEAINKYHAMALFGEKYGDRVRVVRIGDFSTELCGGTHTAATGEIGLIKILKEGSVVVGGAEGGGWRRLLGKDRCCIFVGTARVGERGVCVGFGQFPPLLENLRRVGAGSSRFWFPRVTHLSLRRRF